MNRSRSFDQIGKRLLDQVAFFEEQRINLIDTYAASASPADRQKTLQFIDRYTHTVQAIAQEMQQSDTPNPPPVVVIGCEVSLYYKDDQLEENYTICFPEQVNPDSGYISFLSPIGRQVLMRSRNETIQLETPAGSLEVVIKDIRFVDWDG